ncbi:MAG: hypothetical protein R3Y43_07435 [Alphaproteobacteria bacterium]
MKQAQNALYNDIKAEHIKNIDSSDVAGLKLANTPEFEAKVKRGINKINYYHLLAELIDQADVKEFNKDEFCMAMLGLDGEIFEILYGISKIPELARARSTYDFEEIKMRVEKSWKVAVEIFNIMQAMINSDDETIRNKTSLNKASFILNERIKNKEVENVYGNTQNQKKIWSIYKPYLHILLALDFMDKEFDKHLDEYNCDFEAFLFDNWDLFEKAINENKEVVLTLKLGKKQMSIINENDLFNFATNTNEKINVIQKNNLSNEYLKRVLKEYKAPKVIY